MPDWVLTDEWGNGCKTYIDRSSIECNGSNKLAWVKYYLVPPGKDKTTQKDVREMLMLEEYDCVQKLFRAHRIIFNYTDGTSGEPLSPRPTWAPATGGNESTLQFICKSTI